MLCFVNHRCHKRILRLRFRPEGALRLLGVGGGPLVRETSEPRAPLPFSGDLCGEASGLWGDSVAYTHVPEDCEGRTLCLRQSPGCPTLRHESFRFALLFRLLVIVLSGAVILVLLSWVE